MIIFFLLDDWGEWQTSCFVTYLVSSPDPCEIHHLQSKRWGHNQLATNERAAMLTVDFHILQLVVHLG